MTRRFVLPAVASALLVLAGCATTPTADGGGRTGSAVSATSRVQVDSPALRAAKRRAGVENCPRAAARPGTGSLPSVTLPCLGGGRDVDLARLRGPMVINLFAQWCGPCRGELPYYQELSQKAKGKVKVLGIDYLDTLPDRALQLAKQTGVTYPLLADPDAAVRLPFRVHGLPGVVFVDRSGKVTDLEYVSVQSYGQLRRLVQEHLGVHL
ncbi:MAG: TlpA family protein disulfide reductase [Nocardioidaceae bacterium]